MNMNAKKNLLYRACAIALTAGAAILTLQQSVSAATLVHRYNFTDDGTGTNVVDLIGGPAWHGTIPNGGDFATITNQLILSSGSQQFVQFPPGIVSNYPAITVDMWATVGSSVWGFLWTFGMTDGGGNGGNCIFVQPANARLAIAGVDPSWNGEQNAYFSSVANSTVHLTCVVDPPRNRLMVYTNGMLAGVDYGETWAMSSITCISNYIARSLYNADAYVDVTVDEFRIWNGALNGVEVAGCDVAGPDVIGSTTNAGTMTSITMQVPYYQIVQGGHEAPSISGLATVFTNQVFIDNYLCTYTSGNTNILTVDTNGVITAVGQGPASVTAHYGSASSSVTITVVPPAAALMHRYVFNGDPTDSIGGSAWDGVVSGGDFATLPGQLILASGNSDFVQFPEGIISNYTAVTVDMWASFPSTLPNNCFLWAFGLTTGGAGGNCIFFQPKNGRIAISGGMPSWQAGEQNVYGAGDLSGKTNMHLTAVFNPVAGWAALYVNGKLVGKNTAITFQMNSVASVNNYIARSLYSGDSYMDVNVNEYRIFSGPVSSQGVALADLAGPGAVPNTITNGPGNLVGFTMQMPTTLEQFGQGAVKVLANYQYLTNFDIVANSVFTPAGLTITSSDPSTVLYANGIVQGVKPGTANLTVAYQGVTNVTLITVTPPVETPATLAHRYSCNDASSSTTVADSIGGSAWDGSLPNGGTFAGGKLSMAGTNSQYVNLPANIIPNATNSTVTIDTWATFQSALPGASCFFSFGNTVSWYGEYYLFCAPQGGRFNIATVSPGYTGEQNAYSGIDWSGKTLHITCIVNPPKGYVAIYTNGVLAGLNSSETYLLSGVLDNYSYINQSLYPGDPHFDLTLDEFRIYNGVLTPSQIAMSDTMGPDQALNPQIPVLSVKSAGSNVVVSWSTNYTGFTMASKTSLTGGSWSPVGTSPVISGMNYQVTLPATNTAQFFRLSK